MKLGYIVIKEKIIKTIILIFSVPKSQNSNEEEKTSMATPISSHVKDKNSIFTAQDEDMIF